MESILKCITPKALDITAQGRESASAPWVGWVMESITPQGQGFQGAVLPACAALCPIGAQLESPGRKPA
jgi:hypothetical protein